MGRTIDVLVPFYNEERALRGTVDGCLRQSFAPGDDVRFAFLNDGSEDGSAAVVRRAAATNGRIRFVDHAVNAGKCAVLAHAFRETTSDIVISCDADVRFADATTLRRMADRISAGADLASGNPAPLSPVGGGELGAYFAALWIRRLRARLTDASLWRCHGRLLAFGPRAIARLRDAAWPPYPIGEDQFVFLEVARAKLRFEYVPTATVLFRATTGRADFSRQQVRFRRDRDWSASTYADVYANAARVPAATIGVAFIVTALAHPRAALAWLVQRLASRYERPGITEWGQTLSTKNLTPETHARPSGDTGR